MTIAEWILFICLLPLVLLLGVFVALVEAVNWATEKFVEVALRLGIRICDRLIKELEKDAED